MDKVVIPKNMAQDDLVVISRSEYERLLELQKWAAPGSGLDGVEETDADVEAAIAEGLADIEAGRVFGPFSSVAEFKAHLKRQKV